MALRARAQSGLSAGNSLPSLLRQVQYHGGQPSLPHLPSRGWSRTNGSGALRACHISRLYSDLHRPAMCLDSVPFGDIPQRPLPVRVCEKGPTHDLDNLPLFYRGNCEPARATKRRRTRRDTQVCPTARRVKFTRHGFLEFPGSRQATRPSGSCCANCIVGLLDCVGGHAGDD